MVGGWMKIAKSPASEGGRYDESRNKSCAAKLEPKTAGFGKPALQNPSDNVKASAESGGGSGRV